MKTSATISSENGIVTIKFDIFEAVWGYLLFDNISVMADSKNNTLKLFSFATGKEQTTVELSQSAFDELANCKSFILNFSLGDDNTAIYKSEGGIDLTGKLSAAIAAQFAGKNSTAIECYKAALEANPNLYRVYGLLGRCFRADGNPEYARECYQKAIELAPWSPEAYCNMGVLFQKQGNEENAQAYFAKAIEADNFYCNALIKRAAYLMEKDPEDYELRLINLRLASVYGDITSAQNHIKAYMERMGYDRIAYSDKETALFGDYADAKLQQKLKKIEGCMVNGAFQAAIDAMNEIIASTKETSAEKKVAGWCHSRGLRIKNRLGEEINDKLFSEVKKLLEETPSEETLAKEAENAAIAMEREAIKHIDRKEAEAASKVAIAAIENEVTKDGDYNQPIAGPVVKEFTEEEKNAAMAEAAFIESAAEKPVAPVPVSNVETYEYEGPGAPAPVSNVEAYVTEGPGAPAPVSSVEAYVNEGPGAPASVSSVEAYVNEGPGAPASVSSVEAYVNEGPDAPAPVSSVEAYVNEGPDAPVPVSSVEAYVNEGPSVPAPVPPAAVAPESSKTESENNSSAPKAPNAFLKGVKPVTIQEFFMLVLFEVMRDGEIEESERKFLSKLKELLGISDSDFAKMFTNVKNQVKSSGYEKGEGSKFDMKRAYRNLCKAAWRDGVLEESEKKILVFVSKIFKLSGEEAKKMILEAKK